MTLYNCSACRGVHDSAGPNCQNASVNMVAVGNMHPDLIALVEFKEAAMAWFRNDDEFFRLLRVGPKDWTTEQRAAWETASTDVGTLYDRMLVLARRWHPLENISGPVPTSGGKP